MMARWRLIGVGVVSVLLGVSLESSAAEKLEQGPAPASQTWQLGFTPSYSSGNFGTNTTSTFFYAPLSIRRLFRDGDVTLVIPFVTATSDGRTTLVGGNATRIDDNTHGGTGTGSGGTADDGGCSGKGQSGSGKNRTCGTTGRLPGQKVTTSGLGDIILKGRYYVIEEGDYMPLVAVTGRMKMPTASADQGLGTGAFDYGAGLELSKMLGEHWIAFLDGDDYWLPGGLAARWAVVQQHPQAQFIGTDYRLENAAGQAEPRAEVVDQVVEVDQVRSQRIVQLGGEPNLNPEGMLTRSHSEYVEGQSLIDMIREDLVAERVAIDSYGEMIAYVSDKDPTTRRMLEGILAGRIEPEHARELG